MKNYQTLSRQLERIENINRVTMEPSVGTIERTHWNTQKENAQEIIESVMEASPSGSGIDNGITLSDRSTPNKLCFIVPYHHMDEHGFYCGWSETLITCTPSFSHEVEYSIQTTNDSMDTDEYNQLAGDFHQEYLIDVVNNWLTTDN